MSQDAQMIVAFSFGVAFVVILLVIAIVIKNPTDFQYKTFRIVLSLAAAGVGAVIPGFLNVKLDPTEKFLIQAGGAMAVFVIVYFVNPAKLVADRPPENPPPGPGPGGPNAGS